MSQHDRLQKIQAKQSRTRQQVGRRCDEQHPSVSQAGPASGGFKGRRGCWLATQRINKQARPQLIEARKDVSACANIPEPICRRLYAARSGQSNPMTHARDDVLLLAFAHVLKQIRHGCGLSQEQLALRANVDRTFVGKLESGKHQPSLAVLFKLADASSVEPDELVRRVRERANVVTDTKSNQS